MHRLQLIVAAALGLVVAAALTLVAAVAISVPATAADAPTCPGGGSAQWVDGKYTCGTSGTPGEPGDDGGDGDGGTSGPPPCDLSIGSGFAVDMGADNPGSPYCMGSDVCVLADHGPPWADPPGDKPEGGTAKVRYCIYEGGGGRANPVWSGGDEPPSLAEQAQEAIGNIELGTATVTISPPGRTLVNLDTWYWLDGTMPQTATGTSAFGLVAIATFQSMTVTTGDGSTISCPYVTTKRQAETDCTYTYRRTSGGKKYAVSATATYGLRFEIDGTPIQNIPGAPATLDGLVTSTPLQVAEVQSRVTKTR